MAGNKRLRLELNVLNLFNQKTARHVFNYLNRGAGVPRAVVGDRPHAVDLYKGYDYNAMIRATPDGANAYDPRYGMDDLFEAGHAGPGFGEVPVLRFVDSLVVRSLVAHVLGGAAAPPFFCTTPFCATIEMTSCANR